MLARYFREMAMHSVMGPDEELRTAIEVEKAEVDHWTALLAYLPAADFVLDSLEREGYVACAHPADLGTRLDKVWRTVRAIKSVDDRERTLEAVKRLL